MAQTGFTPIALYNTSTAAAVPVNTNLVNGELAINITDEKLYFKNAAGTVKLIAANVTPAANGGTGLTSAGTSGNVLTSNGTAWTSAALPAGGLTYIFTTTPVTATDKQGVLTSTAGGSFTVTLPATPSTGAQVVVADAGNNWGTNNLTVARNGSTIGGLSENLICDITGASVQFVYDGTSWEVYAQIGGQGGSVVTLDGVQTLTNKTLTAPESTGAIYDNGSVRGNVVAMAALDVDCATGNYFTKTINGASTFTFSNAPSSRAYAFTLELTVTSGSATWPAAVQWPGGTAPTLSTSKTSLLMFVTDDAGTRWRGASLVDYTT